MALYLLRMSSVIPFIERADHRRDRAARIIHDKGAPRTLAIDELTTSFLVPGTETNLPRLHARPRYIPAPRHALERIVIGVALNGLDGMDTLSSLRLALARAGSRRFRFPVSPHFSMVNLARPISFFVCGCLHFSSLASGIGRWISSSSRSLS